MKTSTRSRTAQCRSTLRRLAGAALLAAGATAWAIDVGQPAPELELPGSTVGSRLADLKGRWVYVDFWASWCAPCKQSFPWMDEMQRRYGARGLQVVAINVDARRSDADAFLATARPGFAVAFDGQGVSAKAMGVKGMPTSYLIAPDGRVVLVHQGFRADDRAELENRLGAALGVR